ncbi:antitoxin VapB [Thiothrix eikelboomii]|uniref:Antitoxin VapB n=1 Tax=Thiothrix eikelboomii TaxID=92487 RepID=A0A1T4XWR4_9GAMM|nr:antitoxin VapB [Thiothrix eikelboomii]
MSTMQIAKVFQNGRSQAVRLPKEFRFNTSEVYIEKQGDRVILSPRPLSWDDFFESPLRPSADFMQERVDLPSQERILFE